jgi:hypothetical protein
LSFRRAADAATTTAPGLWRIGGVVLVEPLLHLLVLLLDLRRAFLFAALQLHTALVRAGIGNVPEYFAPPRST